MERKDKKPKRISHTVGRVTEINGEEGRFYTTAAERAGVRLWVVASAGCLDDFWGDTCRVVDTLGVYKPHWPTLREKWGPKGGVRETMYLVELGFWDGKQFLRARVWGEI